MVSYRGSPPGLDEAISQLLGAFGFRKLVERNPESVTGVAARERVRFPSEHVSKVTVANVKWVCRVKSRTQPDV